MLHLRRMGLMNGRVLTATGATLDATLDWWESSERRLAARADSRPPRPSIGSRDHVTRRGTPRRADQHSRFSSRQPRAAGAVIKATAIDSSVIDADGVYRHRGPARCLVTSARRSRR